MPATPYKTAKTRRARRVDLRLTPAEYRAIQKSARRQGNSVNAVIVDALRRHVPGVAHA